MSPVPSRETPPCGHGMAKSQGPRRPRNAHAPLGLCLAECPRESVTSESSKTPLPSTSCGRQDLHTRRTPMPKTTRDTSGYAWIRWGTPEPNKTRERARHGLGKSRCHFESAAQYERITLRLLLYFQRIGKVVQPSKCMRTDIVGQIQPLPGRRTISGKVQSGSGLETSSDSWETSFRPRLSDFMGLLGNTQSKWSPNLARAPKRPSTRARNGSSCPCYNDDSRRVGRVTCSPGRRCAGKASRRTASRVASRPGGIIHPRTGETCPWDSSGLPSYTYPADRTAPPKYFIPRSAPPMLRTSAHARGKTRLADRETGMRW